MLGASGALGVRERKARQYPSPQLATVLEVLPSGRLLVEPAEQPGTVWGPCRWGPRPPFGATPPIGTDCLVLHADDGVSDVWVVALDWTVPDHGGHA